MAKRGHRLLNSSEMHTVRSNCSASCIFGYRSNILIPFSFLIAMIYLFMPVADTLLETGIVSYNEPVSSQDEQSFAKDDHRNEIRPEIHPEIHDDPNWAPYHHHGNDSDCPETHNHSHCICLCCQGHIMAMTPPVEDNSVAFILMRSFVPRAPHSIYLPGGIDTEVFRPPQRALIV